MVKKIISIFMSISMLIIMFSTNVLAEGKSDIDMKVEVGFKGVYKLSYSTPFRIEVQNNRKNINGEIQVEVENNRENLTVYAANVNIPKNSTKNFTINALIQKPGGKYNIRLMENGKEIFKKVVRTNPAYNYDTYFTGILSDNFDSINYFSTGAQMSQNIKLNENNIPDNIQVMNMFNLIIINNFDTSKLSEKQYKVLKNWTENGGTLLIGSGPSYSKTLSIFKDEFIKGEIGNVSTISTASLNKFIGKSGSMSINSLNMKINGGQPIILEGNNTIIYKINKGKGKVVLSSIDFGLKPISDWNGNREFTLRLMKSINGEVNLDGNDKNNYDNDRYYNLDRALKTIPEIPIPKASNFVIIFAIYIIIAGPINYLILKRKDRRELMWVTIPALSLIFAIVMYVSGFSTRINKPISNILTMVDISKDGAAISNTYAAVFTPSKNNIKIQAEDGSDINIFNLNRDYYREDKNKDKIVDSKVIVSPKTIVEFYKSGIWNSNTFELGSTGKFKGTLQCKFNYFNNTLGGSVVNKTNIDFEEGFIVGPEQYVKVGKLKHGENRIINEKMKNYNGDIYSLLKTLYPDVNSDNPYKAIKGKKIEEFRKQQLYNALMDYGLKNNGVLKAKMIFIGVSSTPLGKKIIVNDEIAQSYDRTLVTADTTINFKNGNIIEYPFGFISPVSVSTETLGTDQYNINFYGRGILNVTYKIDKNIQIDTLKLKYSISGNSSSSVRQYLWNNKTLSWEQGHFNSYTIDSKNKGKYIDSNNTFKVRIESSDDSFNVQLPVIQVKGSVK